MRHRIALIAGLLLALGAFAPNALAGTHRTMTYVHPFVDCVTQGSGSYDATFGYSNDNATTQTVPVGDNNYLTPPSHNGAQTTTFQPGTHHAAFTVTAIPSATKLTWTVSLNGHTESVTVSSSSSHACAPTTKVIHVAVDCVTKGATTYDATFAYNNDNATTQTVPVGNDNYLTPPSYNGTQTTTFQPGTHHAAFTVKAIPNGTKLTWTLTFGGHSDTATASSSGNACAPTTKVIHVAVDCVTKGATTYDATFAYNNDNATTQTVPVGNDNYLTPPSYNGTQTTTFQPGTHHAAFTVKAIPNGTKLTWTLTFGGHSDTATASSSGTSCAPAVKRVDVFVQCVTRNGGSYDATFGYANGNATTQTVPVGNDNYLTPPSYNGTQTTTFQPGRVQSAFTVKSIPSGARLTWTVNSGGRSDSATASQSDHQCAASTPPPKVTICHRTNGKRQWVQITVGQKTAAWLLRHGDVMPSSTGSCPAPGKHHHHHHKHSDNKVRQDKRR